MSFPLRRARLLACAMLCATLPMLAWSGTTARAASQYASGSVGTDVSWPQCGGPLPGAVSYGIVGITDGHPFSVNPCLGWEFGWAKSGWMQPSLYINLDYPTDPGVLATLGGNGGHGVCGPGDLSCVSYNYGWNAALSAIDAANRAGAGVPMYWLDVETGNNWSGSQAFNGLVVQGAIAAVRARGAAVGVYSAGPMWDSITGGMRPGVPAWVAGATSVWDAPLYCGASFTGGPVLLSQFPNGDFDGDYTCGQARAYWVASADGGVFTQGSASFHGSASGIRLAAPVVAMAVTPSGAGYWLAAADGGVFTYGDAPSLGSAAGWPKNAPVVGIAATPSGQGYWLVAADGGVFAFGDARMLGNAAGIRKNAPVVGMARTADGQGYWLAAADGGVFAFGDAQMYGSAVAIHHNGPVVGIAATPSGQGYWLAGIDGGVFAFGDAPFVGSAATMDFPEAVIGITPTDTGHGYWLVTTAGRILTFGDAPYYGGPILGWMNAPAVAVAEAPLPPPPAPAAPPPPPPSAPPPPPPPTPSPRQQAAQAVRAALPGAAQQLVDRALGIVLGHRGIGAPGGGNG